MSSLPDYSARAVHGVGADTIADLVRSRAYAVDSGRDETVRAVKAARVIDEALRKRVVRIIALFPNVELGRTISRVASSIVC